jgi:type I restriction enzyme S subunit
VRILYPPAGEQRVILEHLSNATRETEQAIGNAQREIELLREYRIRLIADVVTGKLDVRETAAQLPDEREEVEFLEEDYPSSDTDAAVEEELDAIAEEAEA